MPSPRQLWGYLTRRLLARVLSAALCSVLIVIQPLSKYGGPSAFLALTIKELVFSVQATLAQQLEATVLHLAGGLLGIGLSALGKYIGSLASPNTPAARMIPALFLCGISFLAGWTKSRLPRLTHSMRMLCFVAIWMLTTDVGFQRHIWTEASNFLWVMLVAACTSLFASMVLLKWSSPHFACDVAQAFGKLQACLVNNLDEAFSDSALATPNRALHADLLKRSTTLNIIYQQAAFELRVGRVSVRSLKHLVGTVEHLRRELLWGSSFPQSSHSNTPLEASVVDAFRSPAQELGQAILDSLKAIEDIILVCYKRTAIPSLQSNKQALATAKVRLSTNLTTSRDELRRICDDLDMQQRVFDGQIGFPQKISDLCLFMISLLQMAHEIRYAIIAAEDIVVVYETSPLRLWYPHLSMAWLGVPPSTIVLDERGSFLDEETPETSATSTTEETLEGITERVHEFDHSDRKMDPKVPLKLAGRPFTLPWLSSLVRYLWDHPYALRARLSLSGFIRSFQHSPHIRHAIKNAAGVTLLSIPAFLPDGSPGRLWFASAYGPWMLLSFVWVLETNTGATWRVAYLRLSGTLSGAIYGYVASRICQANPYAVVVMATLAQVPISWVVINTPFPSLGVVAGITIPPILFTPYTAPELHITTLDIAILRTLLIAAGIVAALLMNSIVFPHHCRVMFLSTACRTLGYLNHMYVNMSRDLFHPSLALYSDKHKTLKLELDVRKSLYRMSLLLVAMDDEVSLVPKPKRHYRQVITILQRLLDLLIGLRKIREHIPRAETVRAVAAQRRELVSCICVSLFASEQVFRAKQPLPQFLPSVRLALNNLEKHVEERIQRSLREGAGSLGLSLTYAFAELDVLRDVAGTIDELLSITRQLFGTASWLTEHDAAITRMSTMHEEAGMELRSV